MNFGCSRIKTEGMLNARPFKFGVFITIVPTIILAGCACLVGYTAAGYKQTTDPAVAKAHSGTKLKKIARKTKPTRKKTTKSASRVPKVSPGLLTKPGVPDCSVDGIRTPAANPDSPSAAADPNLLEIARLQLERDCFQKAEETMRAKLRRLQKSLAN